MLERATQDSDREFLGECLFMRGRFLYINERYEEARIDLEKALEIVKKGKTRANEALCLRLLGSTEGTAGKIDIAMSHLRESLLLYKKAHDVLNQGYSLSFMAYVCGDSGDAKGAERYHKQAISAFKKSRSQEDLAGAFMDLGHLFSEHGGDINKAKDAFEDALRTYQILCNYCGQAECLLALGNMYRIKGHLKDSKEHYEKALTLYMDLGDNKNASDCMGGLGDLSYLTGNYNEAIRLNLGSLELMGDQEQCLQLADCYRRLSEVYAASGIAQKAGDYARKGLEISESLGHKECQAFCYLALGFTACITREPSKARDFSQKAFLLFEEVGNLNGKAIAFIRLGDTLLRYGYLREAKDYLEKALQIFRQLNMTFVCLGY